MITMEEESNGSFVLLDQYVGMEYGIWNGTEMGVQKASPVFFSEVSTRYSIIRQQPD